MIPEPLVKKCLDAAKIQLKRANTREKANNVCLTWTVFKNDPEFRKAINEKLEYFKSKNL